MTQPTDADDESAAELPLDLPFKQIDAGMLLCQRSDQSERVDDYGTFTRPRDTHGLPRQ
jgi:hypothetical protein